MPSFQALKISSKYVSWYNTIKNDYAQNYGTRRGCAGTTTKLQIVLKTQENIYSNSSTPKILAKISSLIENFKPEEIRQSSLSLEIRSTLPGNITITLSSILDSAQSVLYVCMLKNSNFITELSLEHQQPFQFFFYCFIF